MDSLSLSIKTARGRNNQGIKGSYHAHHISEESEFRVSANNFISQVDRKGLTTA